MLLENFLSAYPEVQNAPHFVHVCRVNEFHKYLVEKALMPKFCKIFKKKLTYLSLGKPHFRTKNEMPIALIFDVNTPLTINKILPFDSGGFILNMFNKKIMPQMTLQDFELLSISSAKKLINAFYNTTENYLFNRVKNEILLNNNSAATYYYELINSNTSKSSLSKEGSSSIEIISNDRISFDHLVGLVMPAQLILEDYIQEILINYKKINYKLYITVPGITAEECHTSLYTEVYRIYRDKGINIMANDSIFTQISKSVEYIANKRCAKILSI